MVEPRPDWMRLYRNIFHLFIWQGSAYVVPLIVTPYLARVLGLESYGIFGLSLAVVSYGVMLTDWGFSLTATQRVARAVDDPDLLRRLFWGTLLARIVLAVLSFLLLGAAILLVPSFRAIWPPLVASSIAIVATALSANWFLQGLQFMGAFAASALAGRLLTLPLMLIFVHRPGDVVVAVTIQSATQLLSAVVSLVVSARLARLGPAEWDMRNAFSQIHDGWLQFASSLSVSMYTQFNAVFVGFIAGPAQAGLLTGSQRILQAFQGLAMPVNMAVYPQVNLLTEKNPAGAFRMMFRVLAMQTAFAVCLSVAMYLVSNFLVRSFLGPDFGPAVPVVQTLALMPLLAGITNVLGSNMLLPIGLRLSYTVALLAAGVVNAVFLIALSGRFGAVGGAISAVGTEVFLVSAMAAILYANRAILLRMRNGNGP